MDANFTRRRTRLVLRIYHTSAVLYKYYNACAHHRTHRRRLKTTIILLLLYLILPSTYYLPIVQQLSSE